MTFYWRGYCILRHMLCIHSEQSVPAPNVKLKSCTYRIHNETEIFCPNVLKQTIRGDFTQTKRYKMWLRNRKILTNIPVWTLEGAPLHSIVTSGEQPKVEWILLAISLPSFASTLKVKLAPIFFAISSRFSAMSDVKCKKNIIYSWTWTQ